MMKGLYFSKRDNNNIQCLLCPNRCVISENRHGICRVRFNRNGELDLPLYGKLSAVSMDPIEKKPLYHFYPASTILSVGFLGCTFHCPFCQNYSISQTNSGPFTETSPEDLITAAKKNNSNGIAYTYSEPLIHFEYILDSAKAARESGLKNVLVSNGYINPDPADELLEYIDAANIDLKTFNPEFYKKEIGGELEEVKRFLKQAAGRIHLEVTTLVIPGKNDSEEEIESIAAFLSDLSRDIPYHLSCYYPTYKYSIPPTSENTVKKLSETAGRYLKYVYLGNVGFNETNTYCPECKNLLIKRTGYHVNVPGIRKGRCTSCNTEVSVVM
jgi:pyruvate formate lyase activating enzyme